ADQPLRYRDAYLAAVERLIMLVAPIGGVFIAAGDLVVTLLLGSQWTDAGAILRWMGVSAMYMPITYTLSWLYMSQDRTPEMLRAGIVNAGLTVAALLAGLPFGAVGVAAAYAISGIIVRVPVLFWLAGRRGPVQLGDLFRILLLPLCAVAAVAGAGFAVRSWPVVTALPGPAEAAVLAAGMGTAALLVYAAFPRGRHIFRETARQIKTIVTGEARA
ncbi:MAG: polysaccharide biosynthesis C-terminal domain-containing protein, partial [Rhodospirillales bacterium]|nr:polysaccharide biosynthesis C-terminal domain-containing protein [Rhodospirillales bacterium]